MIKVNEKQGLIDYLLSLNLVGKATASMLMHSKRAFDRCLSRTDVENGYLEISVTISNDPRGKIYHTEGYNAKLVKTEKLEHLVSQGIDTSMLDERLGKINWLTESDKVATGDGEIATAFNELIFLRLTGNHQAQAIADSLIIKHWGLTPVEKLLPAGIDLTKYNKQISVKLNGTPGDLDRKQVLNMLEGRSVIKLAADKPADPTKNEWLVIEGGSLVSVPGFDLTSLLRRLPFSPPLDDNTGPDLIMDMIQGNRVKQNLSVDGKNQTVYIEVDAKRQSLRFQNAKEEELNPALFLKDDQLNQNRIGKPDRKPPVIKKRPGKNRGIS